MAEMLFNEKFILSILPEAQFFGLSLSNIKDFNVNVDSRRIKLGEVFVALKGSRFDGHDYVNEAVSNGAVGIIINLDKKNILDKLDKDILNSLCIILVKDTNVALINLAMQWRLQYKYPVIGITGSIGKTTTKEILVNILKSEEIPFLASIGNQNTELGVALNILRMKPDHKVAVFEVGISRQGEMAKIANILRPTIAVITTIAHSHMEGLGSLYDIMHEKRQIFKYFKDDNIGIIHGDCSILSNIAYKHPIVKFGSKAINQVQSRKIQVNNANIDFVLKLYHDKFKVQLDTNHAGRISNSLAAATVAYLFNISIDSIIKGIETYKTQPGRFEHKILKDDKGFVINDCYNANPESMKASLLAFEKIDNLGQKIAILGDMLELGVNGQFWHRQIGRFLRKVPSLNHLILVGDMVKSAKTTLPLGLSYECVNSYQEAIDAVKKRLDKKSVVLVKASNGVKLDLLVKEIAL